MAMAIKHSLSPRQAGGRIETLPCSARFIFFKIYLYNTFYNGHCHRAALQCNPQNEQAKGDVETWKKP